MIMNKKAVTTSIILDKWTNLKSNKFPVKLRITHNRVRKYYTVQDRNGNFISMEEDEFNKTMSEKPRGKFKDYALLFSEFENNVISIIQSIKTFNFPEFDDRFNKKKTDQLIHSLNAYAKELRQENRISSAVTYECTAKSISKFLNGKDISFDLVNPKFLNKYDKWLIAQGRSITTVGIYARNIRTVFNLAVNNHLADKNLYPFGKNGYQIPKGRNIKKALSPEEISILANAPVSDSVHRFYRDLWVFSFLSNGMNVKDIANLKNKNVDAETIVFIRSKTERETRKNLENVVVAITDRLQNIIDTYRNKSTDPEQYLFPILEPGMKAEQQYKKIQLLVGYINDVMKRIAAENNITKPVTTYVARHSFASFLKRTGAPVEFISESLGHRDVSTTRNYLADFEIGTKKQWAEKLAKSINI